MSAPRSRCRRHRAGPVRRLVLLLPVLVACQTMPTAPIPEPLPETLGWTLPRAGGSFLGLHTEENMGASLDDLSFAAGVVVIEVVENSPAARAGVHPGDVVLSLGDEQVADPQALMALVARREAGSAVTLQVQRGDTVFDVPVTLVGAEDEPVAEVTERWRSDPARSRAGWATTAEGALLASAAADSPFPRAGVPVGSVVFAVDGEPVRSGRELIRRLQASEPGARVRVEVRTPDGTRHEVSVRLQDQPTKVTEFGLFILWDYHASVDGQTTSFSLLDLGIFELFQYRRDGTERHWVLFELFWVFEPLSFSTGLGELTE